MTIKEFTVQNVLRCESATGFNHKLSDWSLSDWMLAVVGELGEAANIAKKLNRVRDGIPGNVESELELRAKLRREIADTYIYLDLLCASQDIDLESAIAEVFEAKSRQIGYGSGQRSGDA